MKLKLNKVYTVSKKGKPEKPRLFMQHLVCETAGFK
jgi:DNA (cytosine-5)-methyltransferase 1